MLDKSSQNYKLLSMMGFEEECDVIFTISTL